MFRRVLHEFVNKNWKSISEVVQINYSTYHNFQFHKLTVTQTFCGIHNYWTLTKLRKFELGGVKKLKSGSHIFTKNGIIVDRQEFICARYELSKFDVLVKRN